MGKPSHKKQIVRPRVLNGSVGESRRSSWTNRHARPTTNGAGSGTPTRSPKPKLPRLRTN